MFKKIWKRVKRFMDDVKSTIEIIRDIKLQERTKGIILIGVGVTFIVTGVSVIFVGSNVVSNSGEIDALNKAIKIKKLEEVLS